MAADTAVSASPVSTQPSTFSASSRPDDSTGGARPSIGESAQLATSSSQTASRWWPWLLLLIVVVIVLWLLLR
jgi:hypothetical protein